MILNPAQCTPIRGHMIIIMQLCTRVNFIKLRWGLSVLLLFFTIKLFSKYITGTMTKILNIIWPLTYLCVSISFHSPFVSFPQVCQYFHAVPHARISLPTFSAWLAFSHHLDLSQKGPIIYLGPRIILSQSGLHFFFIAFIHILN